MSDNIFGWDDDEVHQCEICGTPYEDDYEAEECCKEDDDEFN